MWLLLAPLCCAVPLPGWTADRRGLAALKRALCGGSEKSGTCLPTWDFLSDHCAGGFQGVVCLKVTDTTSPHPTPRVTFIDLNIPLRNLSFFDGPVTGELHHLQRLIVKCTGHNHTLPEGIPGQLPGSFPALMPGLHALRLQSCGAFGPVPPQWCAMAPGLVALDLHGNQLTGSIPDCQWKALELLDLSNNNLEGSLPSTLSSASDLQLLYLQSNPDLGGWLDPGLVPGLPNLLLGDLSGTGLGPGLPSPWLHSLCMREGAFMCIRREGGKAEQELSKCVLYVRGSSEYIRDSRNLCQHRGAAPIAASLWVVMIGSCVAVALTQYYQRRYWEQVRAAVSRLNYEELPCAPHMRPGRQGTPPRAMRSISAYVSQASLQNSEHRGPAAVRLLVGVVNTGVAIWLLSSWGLEEDVHYWPSMTLAAVLVVPHLALGALLHIYYVLEAADSTDTVLLYSAIAMSPPWAYATSTALTLPAAAMLHGAAAPLLVLAHVVSCGHVGYHPLAYLDMLSACVGLTQAPLVAGLLTALYVWGNNPDVSSYLGTPSFLLGAMTGLADVALCWYIALASWSVSADIHTMIAGPYQRMTL